ncbi:hypothetical protein GLYMA_04G107200v4 [Glycine max]|uniref:Uncharacterized protein n=1 Tax=Glycine max TaxID=3847 RepID=A0A0R0KBD1_SOYBN|nr:hypothetical protein GYH30_009583 [Glycine max]KRH62418.1 hypothetical protein GLYMA_04G107200v4 [Glycine max]
MVSIVRYVHMIDEATSTIGAPYYYLWLNPLGSVSSTMYSFSDFQVPIGKVDIRYFEVG